MDHLLDDISSGQNDSFIESMDPIRTSGAIEQDAPHWAIESFIPVHIGPLVSYLNSRDELGPERLADFQQFCEQVVSIQHQQLWPYRRRFAAAYATIDPDSDCRDPQVVKAGQNTDPLDSAETARELARRTKLDHQTADEMIAMCDEILDLAGYQKLSREEIEECSQTVSQFGVPLHVDFDLFDHLEVYARGDVMGTRLRRRLRSLYRRETVSVPIYQRMVLIFQLADDDPSDEQLSSAVLHLRMFKNIPKPDVDSLLPGTRVRIRGVDRAKFIIPSLGGFLMSLRKVAQYVLFFTFIALNKSIIIVALIIGYLVKTVLGYFQTKKRYQLSLTRNLYFQKLDSNAGVVYRIIQQAERQSIAEIVFAYYGLLISDVPVSDRKLRRRCERLVREAIDVEVDFRVDLATQRLADMGLIVRHRSGWQVVMPAPTNGGG